ncbi:MAG: hypothetical protein AB7S93_00135 [Xanthobacteraceae bacterium]
MALKHLVAGGILCAATIAALPAAAMPIDNLARGTQANIEQVRWVCGPYRCWWGPNYYYGPRVYRPRVYVAPRVYWGPRYRHRYWRRW